MEAFRNYWTFSAIRGALTILAGFFILTMPQGAVSIMGLARPVGLALACLGAYCWLDAGANVLLALVLPKQARNRSALYARAVAAMVLGGLFFGQVGDAAVGPLVYICIGFALTCCVAELAVAQDTFREYRLRHCYVVAAAMAGCALLLPLAFTFDPALDAAAIIATLSGMVALYGAAQMMLGTDMLLREHHVDHPAAHLSDNWMDVPVPALANICASCPAEAVCSDFTLHGQVARVCAERQPPIVRAAKVATILGQLRPMQTTRAAKLRTASPA